MKFRGKQFENETGIDIIQAVEITGYKPTTVMHYMNGSKFSELFCRKMADYLDISYSEFIDKWVDESE